MAEPVRLTVDRAACAGHGLCYATAPELLDPDDFGNPIVPSDPVPDSHLDTAQRAAAACPERALTLTSALPLSEEKPL
ncbi:ferredoxin [Nocardia nova SH22a]|uniref:Ferredoxin n=1 Tax=Nocardia nova SH22a TaxID=1415166 RepID=W5TLS3_9NOCA|nr:ferredoxin [Nocardia nova]AHH19883.1 ferredoxin [Nocardia nova SH22a]